MGSTTFQQMAVGDTAREAFATARADASYEWGHSGYTGTLADKDGFTEFKLKPSANPGEALELMLEGDEEGLREMLLNPNEADRAIETCDDKWGDAVCVPAGRGKWLFGGWAPC